MGLSTLVTEMADMFSSLSLPTAYAESPAKSDDDSEQEDSEEKDDEDKGEDAGEGEGGEGEEGGDEAEGEEAEEEEEEEEEDEPVDPKPLLEEECARSAECSPYKHHFDDCVARVTDASENPDEDQKGPKEDCVEEFFHLQHCATACAAPKLFRQLK